MKERLVPLRNLKRYSFFNQVELLRRREVALPTGVHVEFNGSGIRGIYDPEEDTSMVHKLPVIGKVVEKIRSAQFPQSAEVFLEDS